MLLIFYNLLRMKTNKRTCIKCRVLKDKKEYTAMPSGVLNPKCNECRNNGREPLVKKKVVKEDDLIIDRSVNSYENKQTERTNAMLVLQRVKEIESKLLQQGKRYVKTGLRAYVLSK